MSDVYVLGVDMIKFGRFPDRTVPDLGAEAALLAAARQPKAVASKKEMGPPVLEAASDRLAR